MPYMRILFFVLCFAIGGNALSQDSTINEQGQQFTLTEAIVRNNFDYKAILQKIKEDTSFYKAFRTLHTIGYSAYNHIEMKDKHAQLSASLDSKTKQLKI
jgi:hypothetical protein